MVTRNRDNVTLQARGLPYHLNFFLFSIKVKGSFNHPATLKLCMILTIVRILLFEPLTSRALLSEQVCLLTCLFVCHWVKCRITRLNWTDFQDFLYLTIFIKSIEKIQFSLQS